jgi:hypothetical protein
MQTALLSRVFRFDDFLRRLLLLFELRLERLRLDADQ